MPFRFNPFTKKLDIVDVTTIPPGTVATLTGDSGGAVSPDGSNNINTLGSGSITIIGDSGTSTLTTQLTGLTNHSVLVGSGTSTITSISVGTTGQVLIGSTAGDPSFASIGTNSGLSDHGVIIGQDNSAFVATAAGTNGQLLIAATNANPAFATVTAGTNITLTTGVNALTIAASQTPLINNYTSIAFANSPYTVLSTDYYISVDTSGGAITIRFPNAPTTSRTFIVKDRTGNSTANNITLTTVGGAVLIDGATSQLINNNHAANALVFNATTYERY